MGTEQFDSAALNAIDDDIGEAYCPFCVAARVAHHGFRQGFSLDLTGHILER